MRAVRAFEAPAPAEPDRFSDLARLVVIRDVVVIDADLWIPAGRAVALDGDVEGPRLVVLEIAVIEIYEMLRLQRPGNFVGTFLPGDRRHPGELAQRVDVIDFLPALAIEGDLLADGPGGGGANKWEFRLSHRGLEEAEFLLHLGDHVFDFSACHMPSLKHTQNKKTPLQPEKAGP